MINARTELQYRIALGILAPNMRTISWLSKCSAV